MSSSLDTECWHVLWSNNVILSVTEASSSVVMEVVGFQRGLDYLLQRGVSIVIITTDRSPSIRKLMEDNYSHIQYEPDPWHVSKSKSTMWTIVSFQNNCTSLFFISKIPCQIVFVRSEGETCNGDKQEGKQNPAAMDQVHGPGHAVPVKATRR